MQTLVVSLGILGLGLVGDPLAPETMLQLYRTQFYIQPPLQALGSILHTSPRVHPIHYLCCTILHPSPATPCGHWEVARPANNHNPSLNRLTARVPTSAQTPQSQIII